MQANEGGWLHRLPAFSVTLAQIHKSKRKQPQLHSIQVLREVCLELGRGRQPRKRTNTSHASLVYRESSKTAGLHRETLSLKNKKGGKEADREGISCIWGWTVTLWKPRMTFNLWPFWVLDLLDFLSWDTPSWCGGLTPPDTSCSGDGTGQSVEVRPFSSQVHC